MPLDPLTPAATTRPATRPGRSAALRLAMAALLLPLSGPIWLPPAHAEAVVARSTERVPPVRFRVGAHSSFDRIVLEGTSTFRHELVREGDDLVVRLDHPIEGKATTILDRLGRSLLSARLDPGELRLRLRKGFEATIAGESANKFIIDLKPRPSPAGVADPPPAKLEALEAEPAEADPSDLDPEPVLASAAEPMTQPDAVDADGAEPVPVSRTPPAVPLVALLAEDVVPAAELAGRRPVTRAATAPAAALAVPPDPDELPPDPIGARLKLRTVADPSGVTLSFDWDRPVPLAAFQRGDDLWLVFGAHAEAIDVDPLSIARALRGQVRSADRQLLDGALAYRLALQPAAAVRITRANARWDIGLGDTRASDPTLRPITLQAGSDGRPRLPIEGRPIDLTDVIAGDRIIAVPTLTSGALIERDRTLPEFELIRTYLGAALRPLRPEIRLRPDHGVQVLERSDGRPLLPLTGETDGPTGEPLAGPQRRASLDLVDFQAEDLLARRRQAEAALAAAPDDRQARLDLVRVLLAMGLAPEARIVAGAADTGGDPLLAAVLASLLEPSGVDPQRLRAASPQDQPEAALWRAYLAATRKDFAVAQDEFRRSDDRLVRYPDPLRRLLGPPIAKAMIESGALNAALALLDGLLLAERDPRDIGPLKLLQAEVLGREQATRAARQRIAAAAATKDRTVAAAAITARIGLDLDTGAIDARAASRELAALAPRWQGQRDQGELEDRLSAIAIDAGSWDTALAAADRATELPADRRGDGPAPADVLARALASPATDLFAKLALLEDRPVAELRTPGVARALADLTAQLDAQGLDAAASYLRRLVPVETPIEAPAIAGPERAVAALAATESSGPAASGGPASTSAVALREAVARIRRDGLPAALEPARSAIDTLLADHATTVAP